MVAQQRYAEAEPLATRAFENLEKTFGSQHAETLRVRRALVALYEGLGKPERAAEYRDQDTPTK